jgi:hypothetical protein
MREQYTHKVLTYVEYRAVSDVFQNIGNIDPPPPPPSESVLPPATPPPPGRKGGWGSISLISWKMPDIGLASYSIIFLRIHR